MRSESGVPVTVFMPEHCSTDHLSEMSSESHMGDAERDLAGLVIADAVSV